ncbi:MAG: hypothetical protein HY711_09800 [Candidatus Melainabacteria bacterium]|nr:hypothetical protein [Candidatus Melainabacteria bacterium]
MSLVRFVLCTTTTVTLALSLASLAQAKNKEHIRLLKGSPVMSTENKASGRRWVKAKILIKAPLEIVWNTVHEQRKSDPDLAYSRVLTQSRNHCTLEQKFVLLPIIGAATCVMVNEEIPLERIDYRLVKSDHFKAMEGSWVLTPYEDGHYTILELSSYLDMGYPVPRAFIETITARKLEKRVTNVKNMAERTQGRLAQQIPG